MYSKDTIIFSLYPKLNKNTDLYFFTFYFLDDTTEPAARGGRRVVGNHLNDLNQTLIAGANILPFIFIINCIFKVIR